MEAHALLLGVSSGVGHGLNGFGFTTECVTELLTDGMAGFIVISRGGRAQLLALADVLDRGAPHQTMAISHLTHCRFRTSNIDRKSK